MRSIDGMLACDPLGKKPLFRARIGTAVVFASEVKGLDGVTDDWIGRAMGLGKKPCAGSCCATRMSIPMPSRG